MNGLSDSLTIGLILALVFGALFFYLYSRIGQAEKRVGLTENILLDLKMATENTLMAMAGSRIPESEEQVVEQPIASSPEPIRKEEVEQIPDEEFYKQVIEQVHEQEPHSTSTAEEQGNRVDVNYEAMTLKELKALAKSRGINVSASAHKKDVIDILKRQGQTASVLEPVPGGSMSPMEEGFPVELGSTENRRGVQE
jgi:hypothetical protein